MWDRKIGGTTIFLSALLDFGIAKILDPDLAADTLTPTVTAMRIMTPDYAGSEQAHGEPVTPATDLNWAFRRRSRRLNSQAAFQFF